MEEKIRQLEEELEKARFQLYVFYELTKAMRTTLRLDEIIYIILTGLTAHEGLGFNRAFIFFTDESDKKIKGFMGIGALDGKEADEIWCHIEKEKKDLYDLIVNYNRLKENSVKSKFMEFVQSLSFPLNKESGILFETLMKKSILRIKKDKISRLKNDPLVKKLKLEEFVMYPLCLKGNPAAIVVIDNYITKKPITDDDVKFFSMFMEQATGAIENSQSFENTLTKAHTDSLTSLWNYGYFQYKLEEELNQAKTTNSTLSVMMIDIDDFKKFNDSFGHIQGDEALKKISNILKENCRKIDILCRYGGEEFAMILPGNSKEEASLLAERIRKSIMHNEILKNRFTVSIGISSCPTDAVDKSLLINKADQALYAAKRNGKNQIALS